MQITRHNYETFFLLYADGALQSEECAMVNNFIDENEDLRIELQMLQATVLPVEEITFIDKSFLYRDTIFDEQLQEKLLLKIDEELSANENAELDIAISKNRFAKATYNQLLQTKLNKNETIVFTEKQLLYKKEPNRIVFFNWRVMAAAAIFIGVVLFVGIQYYTTTKQPTGNIATSDTKKTDLITSKNNTTIIKENTALQNTDVNNTSNVVNIKANGKKTMLSKKEVINNNTRLVDVQQNLNDENKKYSNQGLVKMNNVMQPITTLPNTNIANVALTAVPKTSQKADVLINENIIPLDKVYGQTIAFNEDEKSENKILYIDEDEVKKSKTGGFFRKIKRIVERTANIKTGNTLQIAGFEIAAK